jgi:hypothetical protein
VGTWPGHGALVVESTLDTPRYPPNGPLGHCNGKPVQGTKITYQPNRRYVGIDDFDIIVTLPNGSRRKVSYTVRVG